MVGSTEPCAPQWERRAGLSNANGSSAVRERYTGYGARVHGRAEERNLPQGPRRGVRSFDGPAQ